MNRKQRRAAEKQENPVTQKKSPAAPEAFGTAVRLHQAGKLQEAERLYRQVLASDPGHADSLHLLGVIAAQRGRHDLSVDLIKKAIAVNGKNPAYFSNLGLALMKLERVGEAAASYGKSIRLNPADAAAHNNLGVAFRKLGRLDEAAASHRQACILNPNYADAHYNLGIVLRSLGRLDEAVACWRRTVALEPGDAEAHAKLGGARRDQDQLDEAIACFRKVLQLRPNVPENYNLLGATLQERGVTEEAIACFRKALDLKPDFPEAHYNLGNLFKEQVRLDEAVACYRTTIGLLPDFADAYNNLGNALQQLGLGAEAIACYRQAIILKPNYGEAHNNLGNALQERGLFDEAVASYRRAIDLRPDYVEAHSNLGWSLQQMGRWTDAIASYRTALRIEPDVPSAALGHLAHQLRHICEWEEIPRIEDRVMANVRNDIGETQPFTVLSMPSNLADHLRCAKHFAEKFQVPATDRIAHLPGRKNRKIKIGYMSSDFHAHATSFLIAELIERHDRDRFEIWGYSHGIDDDSEIRHRIMSGFDHFIDLRPMSHKDAARRIKSDEIDILIDLNGYAQKPRTMILAFHPAPIQVNYLGYPGTMGVDFIDYIIADPICIPPAHEPFYSEKVVRLPDSYQPNDTLRRISPDTPSRTECGLPEHGFVFCCFNNSYKITPELFGIWMRLLRAVPGSVLWILAYNAETRANLLKEAEARGVPASRLIFAPFLPLPDHLARHRLADLFLDTLPYNAHTTASDALWAGLPVLTCIGEAFAGRVAASLLNAVGARELICSTLAEYESKALALATDPKELSKLRDKIRRNKDTAPLFDIERFTRNMESAYLRMWDIHCAGQNPRPFDVG